MECNCKYSDTSLDYFSCCRKLERWTRTRWSTILFKLCCYLPTILVTNGVIQYNGIWQNALVFYKSRTK